jgi:hypothetical protein
MARVTTSSFSGSPVCVSVCGMEHALGGDDWLVESWCFLSSFWISVQETINHLER